MNNKVRNNINKILSIILAVLELRLIGFYSDTINKKSIITYNEVIEDFSLYLNEHKINDVQEIFEYYNYALWNGYFSHNHEMKYSLDRGINLGTYGMNNILGEGVCLNYSDMLSDIYNKMGFKSYNIFCYVDSNNFELDNIRTNISIERKVANDTSEITKIFYDNIDFLQKIFGNHAITCVEYNNEYYFYDPTNLIYLSKNNLNDLSVVNGKGEFDLRYICTLFFENTPILKISKSYNPDNYDEIVYSKEEINIDVDSLEDFYLNEKEKYETIYDDQNNKNFLMVIAYSILLAIITMRILISILKKLLCYNDEKDIKSLLSEIKEIFNSNNITSEQEILKVLNSLIENKYISFEDKNLLIKTIKNGKNIILSILNNCDFRFTLISFALNELGYKSYVINSKRYKNNKYDKNIELICIKDKDNYYFYDFETEEILCKINNKSLVSLNKEFNYKIDLSTIDIKEYLKIKKYLNIDEDINIKNEEEKHYLNEKDVKHLYLNKK